MILKIVFKTYFLSGKVNKKERVFLVFFKIRVVDKLFLRIIFKENKNKKNSIIQINKFLKIIFKLKYKYLLVKYE